VILPLNRWIKLLKNIFGVGDLCKLDDNLTCCEEFSDDLGVPLSVIAFWLVFLCPEEELPFSSFSERFVAEAFGEFLNATFMPTAGRDLLNISAY